MGHEYKYIVFALGSNHVITVMENGQLNMIIGLK